MRNLSPQPVAKVQRTLRGRALPMRKGRLCQETDREAMSTALQLLGPLTLSVLGSARPTAKGSSGNAAVASYPS